VLSIDVRRQKENSRLVGPSNSLRHDRPFVKFKRD
jgi:hypothetical protein